MEQITFISVTDLKENTIIQDNVGEKILKQSILEFQELELEPLLGLHTYQRLSNELVSGATISGYTLPADDIVLLSYIKPFMLYGALIYALNPLHFKVTNKGVQKLSDSNATVADKSEMDALKSSYTAKKDAYKKRLTEYIASKEQQEEYTENRCEESQDTTYSFTGIAIMDNEFDREEAYKSSAYRTGYYRRRF